MMGFDQMERRQRARRLLFFLLGNLLPPFDSVWPEMRGRSTWPNPLARTYTPWRSFHLVPVKGQAAVMTGLGYIGLGLFGGLSVGPPPPEGRRWFWRAGRWIVRWGSLAMGFWLWQKVYSAGK